MSLAIVLSLFLFSNPAAQSVYTQADFVTVNGDSLRQRFDAAVAQGRKDSGDTFWVAYEMSGRDNVRINSVDGIEVFQTATPERVGMFLLVRKSDGAVERLRIVNLGYEIRVHDRKVYWLGKPGGDDSAALLLSLARTSASTQVKKDAVFWLGQEISRLAGEALQDIANSDPEVEVQKQAVFAISQRRNDESITWLMRIAREHANPAVRQQAIFWLGQKRDPRVLDFFEQLLKK